MQQWRAGSLGQEGELGACGAVRTGLTRWAGCQDFLKRFFAAAEGADGCCVAWVHESRQQKAPGGTRGLKGEGLLKKSTAAAQHDTDKTDTEQQGTGRFRNGGGEETGEGGVNSVAWTPRIELNSGNISEIKTSTC